MSCRLYEVCQCSKCTGLEERTGSNELKIQYVIRKQGEHNQLYDLGGFHKKDIVKMIVERIPALWPVAKQKMHILFYMFGIWFGTSHTNSTDMTLEKTKLLP